MSIFSHTFCALRRQVPKKQPEANFRSGRGSSLADTPVGMLVQVAGFRAGLAGDRCSQLQSYGLSPGQPVKVLQHVPVTVLQIEQFELALERDMAAYVEVIQY